jgi:hypothetical protein
MRRKLPRIVEKVNSVVLESKNQLEAILPYAMIATKKWLVANGLGRHSLDNALKSRKLEALAAGVYARSGVRVPWEGVVTSLQRMSEAPVHVGGVTALELFGYGHYLSNSPKRSIHLYSEKKLPAWVNRLNLESAFQWHGTRTLWPQDVLVDKAMVKEFRWREELPELLVSTAEKASLEMLVDVPKSMSFEHADELMQGLTSLSPRKLESLLKACRSVKVKRLFFWFADRQGYSWARKLNCQDFDLGKGKRLIAKNGRLDKKYEITVPENMYGSD